MKNSKKIKVFFQILGPIIFIYILFRIDFGLLKKELANFNMGFLLMAVFFMAAQIVVKAEKWRLILTSLSIHLTRLKTISLCWLGLFVGVVTPGRLGELIKVYFLKNKGYSAFRSFFSVLADRIVDVGTLLLFGFFIFLFFLKGIGIYILFIGSGLILFLVFLFLLIDNRSFLHKFFTKAVKNFFPIDFEEYNKFTLSKLWQGLRGIKKSQFIVFFAYLIISWLFYFAARYMIVLSLGINLSFLDASAISALMAIVTMLPVSVAGIGTREAAAIYLFGLFSIAREPALLFSLFVFVTDLFILSFGLIPYIKESFLVKNIRKQID